MLESISVFYKKVHNGFSTYSLFESGAGGYVAVDLSTNKSVLWFTDEQPEYDIVFWDVVDEWIVIGMEE